MNKIKFFYFYVYKKYYKNINIKRGKEELLLEC